MKKFGFTLVELMVAIAIIGLIAVLSIPGYTRFRQSWLLRAEAEQFAATMRAARAAAVMKSIDVVFRFDMDQNTFFYFEDSNRNGLRDGKEYQSATYSLSPGISFSALTLPSAQVTFGALGNTRFSGTVTIRNSYNRFRSIRIYGGTGNVAVD